MQDKRLIEIACIKNITGIYCYSIDNKDIDSTNVLGIDIVYDGSKTLSMNSNDDYFINLLERIRELYNKNEKQISFLNDFSKQVIENYQLDNSNNNFTNHNFYPMNTNEFYLKMMSDYIKQALELIIKLFYLDKDIKVENVKGYHGRYSATYTVDNKKYFLPFSCFLKDNYNLEMEVNGIKNQGIKFNGEVVIKDHYTRIKWLNNKQDLECKIVNDIDNGCMEKVIRVNNEVIYIENISSVINDEELNKINDYLSKLNLNTFNKGIKISDNSYLFYESNIVDDTQNNYACHYTYFNDGVSIIYKKTSGYLEDKLFTPYKYLNERINMMKIIDSKYLIQKENLNNHRYQYQMLDNNTLYDIKVDDIDSIDDIKTYQKGVIK